MTQETFNLAEAAEYLKLGYEATKELFDAGVLPGASLNNRHTVIHHSDLEAFLRETARRQAEERRRNIQPTDRAAAPIRRKHEQHAKKLPDLKKYENQVDGKS
jgi:hypothetical protein